MARKKRGGGERRWDSQYPRYTPSAPLPTHNGITTRSGRGEIGGTWWSRTFVHALEAFTDSKRLGRGRRYARSGQVMDLWLEPGAITARVQGSRRTPYHVRIDLAPLAEQDWRHVEEQLASQAVFLAALLAGEMPRDIEQVFTACGLRLFPSGSRELATACSCPDWANPCKHVAATYYILAERFDEDPFLILAWRGRPREDLLHNLRALRAGSNDAAVPDGEPARAEPDAGDREPLPPTPSSFWRRASDLSGIRFDMTPPALPDAVLREAGPPPPPLAGLGLPDRLAAAYAAMTAEAQRRLEQDEGGEPDR